ncbi:MAG: hypothetical protein ACI9SC_000430 [Gammaproteobacteria bacterium]|jgi:hypothetical protein
MYKQRCLFLVLMLVSFNSLADGVSITVKPLIGIVGTTSLTFHEDEKVTMLVYESAAKITETLLEIGAEDSSYLKMLAVTTLNEYLNMSDFRNISEYAITFGISRTEDTVTKNISSRRLTKNALEIIDEFRKYTPRKDLLNIGE